MSQSKKTSSPFRNVARALMSGWLLFACAGIVLGADPFKVVLLPDTQYYTEQSPVNNRYSAQTSWIKSNAEAENIKFMIHLGDLVDNRNADISEWQIADAAHDILEAGPDPVPYSVMPGNHDLTGSGPPGYTRNATLYNAYFGSNRFAGQPWYGGYFGTNESNYCFFSAGDLDFMVMSLEFLPRDAVLSWANNVIQANPDRRVIVATHKYSNRDGSRSTATEYDGMIGNNGDQIFDKLVKNNENVFMVVSGHVGPEALNVAFNTAGKPVYEILSDYQKELNGGDGWLRTLQFSPDTNQITVESYSPTLDQHNLYGKYTLTYDMTVPEPIPGDATGDGNVDVSDLGILATNYGAGGGFDWEDADFTGDGYVDVSDLGILATWYGTTPVAQSVPEPSTFAGLLGFCLAGLLAMARRRS